jgi:GT2 family glycosyltransferase
MSEDKQEKIAAIVVTYNRRQLLVECLDSLLNQTCPLNAIYIVDNCSVDGTCKYLVEKGVVDSPLNPIVEPLEAVKRISLPSSPDKTIEIHYIRMHENTGGAGGFCEGIKRGYEAGYDWLWLMDDDLVLSDDSLKLLVEKKNILRLSYGYSFILNSLVFSKEKADNNTLAFPMQELTKKGYPKIGVYHRYLSDIESKLGDGLYQWACPFNGTLIPRQVITEIGFPNSELYIKGDEKDYFWRALKKFKIYTVVNSKVFHPEPKNNEFTWKEYYAIRNMFIVNSHLNLTILRNAKLIFKSIVRGFRNGKGGLVLVFHAIKDGLLRNLGRKEGVNEWLNM